MAQNTAPGKTILQSWTKAQIHSKWHIIGVILFGVLAIAPRGVAPIAILLISVVAAVKKIPSLVITAVIVSVVTMLFPPLAGIVSIVFFFMKLAYIKEHYRPLLIGLALCFYLIVFSGIYYYSPGPALMQLVLSSGLFHFILVYLYHREYSAQEAITIAATVPLFIVMLILPFLLSQLDEIVDYFDGDSYDDFMRDQMYADQGQGVPADTHWVDGFTRENPDGSFSHVEGHFRTNPDGIESNNLSFKK